MLQSAAMKATKLWTANFTRARTWTAHAVAHTGIRRVLQHLMCRDIALSGCIFAGAAPRLQSIVALLSAEKLSCALGHVTLAALLVLDRRYGDSRPRCLRVWHSSSSRATQNHRAAATAAHRFTNGQRTFMHALH